MIVSSDWCRKASSGKKTLHKHIRNLKRRYKKKIFNDDVASVVKKMRLENAHTRIEVAHRGFFKKMH